MKADKQCVVETGTEGFMIVSIEFLRDKRLSAKAMGLLAFMLSCSDEWDYSISGLAECMADGKSSIRTAIKELEEHGYVVRERIKDPQSGLFNGVRYFIRPFPQNTRSNPLSDFPTSDERMSDNRTQSNNKQSNIKQSSTCNNQTNPEREEKDRTNERVRARETEEKPQEPPTPSGDLDKIIEDVHGRLRRAYPDVPLRYQNERFLEREREIVGEALEGLPPGTSAAEWEARVLKALGNPDFRKWLMANRRGDWCPSLGNVLADGCWERFSTEGHWL